MEGWQSTAADIIATATITGLAAVAKWVHSISMTVSEHTKTIAGGERLHEECSTRGLDTAVRLAEAEQNYEHLHETIIEVKQDVKEILKTIRHPNGGRVVP